MEAHAEFDFIGRADDELSFGSGALLLITETGKDENWYKAVLNGVEGFVPKNYIKFILPSWFWKGVRRTDAENQLKSSSNQIGSFCIRKSESFQGSYSLSVKNCKDSVHHYKILMDKEGLFYIWLKKFKSLDVLVEYYRSNSVTPNSTLYLKDATVKIKYCTALFNFTPVQPGEIALIEGEEIRIIDDSDSNWWQGTVNGKQGTFPANYVALIV